MSSIIKSSRIITNDQISTNSSKLAKGEPLSKQANIDYKEIIDSAKLEAEKILKEAKTEKEKMIEKAEEQKEDLIQNAYERSKNILEKSREEGYTDGYNQGQESGYKEGYKQGKEDSDKLIKEALEIKDGYFQDRKNLLKELEQDVIELVIEIYEKIIREKNEEDSDTIISLVLNGIENLDVTDKLTVISSKEDYDILELSKDIILAKASMISDLNIKYDTTMVKGDCILETPKGSIDASLNNQLSEVKEILYSVLNNE